MLSSRPRPTDPHAPRARAAARESRAGRAGLWVALMLAGLGALIYLQMGPGDPGAGHGDGTAAQAAPRPGQAGPAAPELDGPTPGDAAALRINELPPPAARPPVAPGAGRIRGELRVHGEAQPEAWTLELLPSAGLSGSEVATSRRLEFGADERTFELTDLPLAGFDLLVSAAGFNGRRVPLLLTPTRGDVTVVLALYPAGSLGGRVVDPDRIALPRLPLTLVQKVGGSRLQLETDALGGFQFEAVPDGEWTLHFGSEHLGIVEPIPLRMAAPGLVLETIEVPRMGQARVRVLDPRRRPVMDARVRGYGPSGGLIDARTDADGWAIAHFLPPGPYTVRTTVPDVGRAVAEFTLEDLDDEAPSVVLELRP